MKMGYLPYQLVSRISEPSTVSPSHIDSINWCQESIPRMDLLGDFADRMYLAHGMPPPHHGKEKPKRRKLKANSWAATISEIPVILVAKKGFKTLMIGMFCIWFCDATLHCLGYFSKNINTYSINLSKTAFPQPSRLLFDESFQNLKPKATSWNPSRRLGSEALDIETAKLASSKTCGLGVTVRCWSHQTSACHRKRWQIWLS